MHIFVEGPDDEKFINMVFGEIINAIYGSYKIIRHSKMSNKKIRKYIQSIKANGMNYLFIADQDGNKSKKDDILKKFSFLDVENVFISVYEIESWIIAGINNRLIKKYHISNIIDTQKIDKEKFNNMIPKNIYRNMFISEILNEYNMQNAVDRNVSFKEFYEYLQNKKAS